MRQLFARIFGTSGPESSRQGAARLSSANFPRALYVIGDVHGRLDLLEAIEEQIAGHAGVVNEDVWVVLVGDVVDRGPSSAQVSLRNGAFAGSVCRAITNRPCSKRLKAPRPLSGGAGSAA